MSDLNLFTAIDEAFMSRCIFLARKGGKNTKTNPQVGCVIVHNHKIIGEGYHKIFGGPHAEIEAFGNVAMHHQELIADSTLYVTLEPCSHHGKTPPCAEYIVSMGIKKVIAGSIDPNPRVAGNGIKHLRGHGIDVKVGLLNDETDLLIAKFKTNLSQRPYIILKWAKSADNYLGIKGSRTPLSNAYINVLVHKWRGEVDAILVGRNTVVIDNPALTVRHHVGEHPIRIVLDSQLVLDRDYAVFEPSTLTYVINVINEDQTTSPIRLKVDDMYDLPTILTKLFHLGITSILVEGGAEVLKSFIKANLWDEARVISTPKLLRDGVSAPNIEGQLLQHITIDQDHIHIIKNNIQA